MANLTTELASLRIDRNTSTRSVWRRAIFVGLIMAIAAVCGLCLVSGRLDRVEVETVRPSTLSSSAGAAATPILTATGYLVARRQAVVSAKIQGRLAQLNVDEGSHVLKEEVIARLDNADYQAQIDVARAQIVRAEADLAEQQRQLRLARSLADAGVISQDQLEAALSRVRAADASLFQDRAALSLSEANFQNTVIRAPFAGVVLRRMAEVGESVAPIPPGVNLSTSSGSIVALADMATLEVEADVSESNVGRLQNGQPAQVSVEAFPNRTYQAILRQVVPTADRTKATVTVRVSILHKGADLKPEMSAKVTFLERVKKDASRVSRTQPVISVPKSAVRTRDGGTFVLEVESGRVHVAPVSIGDERQGQVIVKEGLTGSETLVLHPPDKLKEGDIVRAKS